MKKLKIIARNVSLALLFVLSLAVIGLSLVAGSVKTGLLQMDLPDEKEVADTIVVHFIHGSIPQPGCSHTKKRLGGYLGGHIEIQVDDRVQGFIFDTLPINYLPKHHFNSKFEVRDYSYWDTLTKDDKITSIHFPVTAAQKTKLTDMLVRYAEEEPYDYAFLGQRCASSTAEILSDAGILNEFSDLQSIIAYFYPRTLRHTMMTFAEKHDLKIERQKGIECHSWE